MGIKILIGLGIFIVSIIIIAAVSGPTPTETPTSAPKLKEAPTPSITNVTPSQILNNVENYLTISGSNFKQGAQIIIGNKKLGAGNVIDNKTIAITIPPGALTLNVYGIQVVNPDGKTATLHDSLIVTKPQPPASAELTTEEISKQVSSAVVQILNDVKDSVGSGMIIDSSGHILTNEHVIRGDSAVGVNYNGQIFYDVPVIGWNAIKDLAVVKLSGNNFSYVNLGNSDDIILGQNIVALGYPLSDFPSNITVLEGIISRTSVIDNSGVAYLQTSANIQHGSSGGPLVDMNANVMGVNSWCPYMDIIYGLCPTGYGLAVKINEAKSILPELKAGAKVSYPAAEPTPKPKSQTKPEVYDSIIDEVETHDFSDKGKICIVQKINKLSNVELIQFFTFILGQSPHFSSITIEANIRHYLGCPPPVTKTIPAKIEVLKTWEGVGPKNLGSYTPTTEDWVMKISWQNSPFNEDFGTDEFSIDRRMFFPWGIVDYEEGAQYTGSPLISAFFEPSGSEEYPSGYLGYKHFDILRVKAPEQATWKVEVYRIIEPAKTIIVE